MKTRKVIATINQKEREGHFHGFFQVSDGDGAEPVAVVELEDGSVQEIAAHQIKFAEKPE